MNDLYQEIILDHSKRPRNCHSMDDANRKAEGYNPLCGDKLKLFLNCEDDVVEGRQLSWLGLRDFDGLGIADDRKPEGQDRERGRSCWTKFHDLLTTDTPVAAGTRQAGRVLRRPGLSGAREMRHAGLAYAESRAQRRGDGSRYPPE